MPEEHPATQANHPCADTYGNCYQPRISQQQGHDPECWDQTSGCTGCLARYASHRYLFEPVFVYR
jgi:hypothetical protein